MTQLNLKAKISQMIQIHNEDTNQNSYLIEQNGEWVEITENEYNKKIDEKLKQKEEELLTV